MQQVLNWLLRCSMGLHDAVASRGRCRENARFKAGVLMCAKSKAAERGTLSSPSYCRLVSVGVRRGWVSGEGDEGLCRRLNTDKAKQFHPRPSGTSQRLSHGPPDH